ncbi:RNA polymerase subunit sigma-70 [Barrientosiimonas endolithica]|uniref:RNA polymerase sigma factor n=1 Tax=Barrientosiimonas endolithica TaxID=1535208 RepID=A0ABM8HEC9_9MICO|nr:RNA polymerase sigma factor [Barrientosiimonas endolithica]
MCLTALERRPRRALPVDLGPAAAAGDPLGAPAGESAWVEPYPDLALGIAGVTGPAARLEQREAVELAFVTALQYLPGNQRAALILREVLGYSAGEVAELLETTPAAVNSALQHARASVARRVPKHSQQATLRRLGDQRLRELVSAYTRALEQGDMETMLGLLAEDVTWAMPPTPTWYQGHAAVRAFLAAGPFRTRWRHVPTYANGQLAIGCYGFDAESGSYRAWVLDVLTVRGDRIAAVTAFVDPGIFDRFDLPVTLSGRPGATGQLLRDFL